MNMTKRGWLLILSFLSCLTNVEAQKADDKPFFFYDQPDQKIEATSLENPLFYDAGAALSKEGLWISWLELIPGKGDRVWVGLRGQKDWTKKIALIEQPEDYANPTPIIDQQGKLWVSYEVAGTNEDWNVIARFQKADGTFSSPIRVSPGTGADINHRVAKDPKGGVWFVWQTDRQGQFDILARHVTADGMSETMVVSDSPFGDWHPALTVAANGDVNVVWDSFDGSSYDVLARPLHQNEWGSIVPLANGPQFQAHAQIAFDGNGKLWACWEEDGISWGRAYRSRKPETGTATLISDKIGPVHRFRRLQLVELDPTSFAILRQVEVPMPKLQEAAARSDAPAGVKYTGAFYEGGQLTTDGKGRLWLTYRHFYVPWAGIVPEHHKQDSWLLYARCLLPDGWSKLYSFDIGQGDGLQRFSPLGAEDGITAVWTTGRTDRRKSDKPHGITLGSINAESGKAKLPFAAAKNEEESSASGMKNVANRVRPSTEVNHKKYELFFGDLHRHTDISLCFAPNDGTIDDAYRYAIDAAPLDFLGITDHTHDMAMGDPLSLIWWRSRKEVKRHQLEGRFVPFYSYERSRQDTDHNVISLRDDMLRPHTYPLSQFWTEIDTNTFTIAHQPFNRLLWNYKDEVHRPLVEIYQGFRNDAKEADAKEGLTRGHKFGIIASSDHLSTDASFACVWAEKPTRESIFRAMQARRTYGATAKIQLKVFAGEHWMGESFSTKTMPSLQIEVKGTAPISKVEIFRDCELVKTIPGTGKDGNFVYESEASLKGPHIFHIRLEQADGNRAWSSPLWVDIKP